MSNIKIIARNTGWYGLENIISSVVTLFTSIAIARTLGPSKMGYIIYVMWILAILCGGSASLIVLFGLFYLLRVLEPEDRDRFRILTGMLPKPLAGPADKIISLLIRPDIAGATMTNV